MLGRRRAGGVVGAVAAHDLVEGPERVVLERHVGDPDVVVVRADGHHLAAERGVAAGEDGHHVPGREGRRRLGEGHFPADQLPDVTGLRLGDGSPSSDFATRDVTYKNAGARASNRRQASAAGRGAGRPDRRADRVERGDRDAGGGLEQRRGRRAIHRPGRRAVRARAAPDHHQLARRLFRRDQRS